MRGSEKRPPAQLRQAAASNSPPAIAWRVVIATLQRCTRSSTNLARLGKLRALDSVPAHEHSANRSESLRAANPICPPNFCFTCSSCRSRRTHFPSAAPFGFFFDCLSHRSLGDHRSRTPAPPPFLASAVGLRSSGPRLLHVYQPFDGSGLVSLHVHMLRGWHPLGI